MPRIRRRRLKRKQRTLLFRLLVTIFVLNAIAIIVACKMNFSSLITVSLTVVEVVIFLILFKVDWSPYKTKDKKVRAEM